MSILLLFDTFMRVCNTNRNLRSAYNTTRSNSMANVAGYVDDTAVSRRYSYDVDEYIPLGA